eukprot:COSAG01_NODE_974_length_12367_cov_33.179899_1_plen_189_part_00
MTLETVKAILHERDVFSPDDFTLKKLPTVLRILRDDERRVCMLIGKPAEEIIDTFGTTHVQSRDGELYVLFQHDFPDYWCGLTQSLNDQIEITQRRIRRFFCPPPTADCVICKEETVTDIEGKNIDINIYPAQMHPDGNIFECKSCLSVVCAECYPRYFSSKHVCPVCNRAVPHLSAEFCSFHFAQNG